MEAVVENKVGYKKTKLGWIPEGWKEVRLDECLKEKPNYGLNAPSVKYSDELPTYLRITDIDDNGNFIKSEKVSVNHPEMENFYLDKGDIVFARTGNTTGKTYMYNQNDGKLIYAGFLIRVSPEPSILHTPFLSLFTQTAHYWYWVKVMSIRSGQPGINGKEYASLKIPLPPLPEQKKIAEILSTWDKSIEQLQKLISEKQKLKKGLMQQLLTGKKRFAGFTEEWKEVRLGDVFEFISTNSYSRNDMSYEVENDSVFNIHYGDIHATYKEPLLDFQRQEQLIPIVNKDAKSIAKPMYLEDGDLVVADASEDYEGVADSIEITNLNGRKVLAGLHTFALRDKSDLTEAGFRTYLLKHPKVKNTLKSIATGSKVYGISKANITKIKLILPSKEEQKEMAKVFHSADVGIRILENKLISLQKQKNGLMQKLLTGEVRVKIN